MAEIRRIRPGERAAALDTIVAAFRHDPQLRWWFPGEEEYDASAPAFFGVLLDTRVEGGEVWVADGGDAVAMWLPPGGNLIGPELASARYAAMVAGLSPAAADRVQRTDEAVDGLLPSGAHWYLGVLACHPRRRGQGLGTAVTAPVLAAADRAGLPVALETSSQVNVGFYTRRGFCVLGRSRLEETVTADLGGPAREAAGPATGAPCGPTAASATVSTPVAVSAHTAVTTSADPQLRTGITVVVMQREPRS